MRIIWAKSVFNIQNSGTCLFDEHLYKKSNSTFKQNKMKENRPEKHFGPKEWKRPQQHFYVVSYLKGVYKAAHIHV